MNYKLWLWSHERELNKRAWFWVRKIKKEERALWHQWTDRQTLLVTSWAPNRAKRKTSRRHNFHSSPMVVGLLCVYSNNLKVFCISLEVRSIDELMMKYYCWRRKCKPAQIWEKVEKKTKSLLESWSLLFIDLVLIQLWCLELGQEISSSEHFC